MGSAVNGNNVESRARGRYVGGARRCFVDDLPVSHFEEATDVTTVNNYSELAECFVRCRELGFCLGKVPEVALTEVTIWKLGGRCQDT